LVLPGTIEVTSFKPRGPEWPTLGLIAANYTAWALATLAWDAMPAPLVAAAVACCIALHGSLQHEAIHGHPTGSRRLNLALVWLPLPLWMPLSVYESSHRSHHRSDLTCPLDDPESWYVTPRKWARMSPLSKRVYEFNNTFLGRMVIGPWIVVASSWRRILRGDPPAAHRTACVGGHLIGVGIVMLWVTQVAGMPAYVYLLACVWPGISLSLMRSFVEHRAAPNPDHRSAIVRGGALTRLLFLNNNYHWVHHRYPALPWYALPEVYRREEQRIDIANGGFRFTSYTDIARRYLLKPWTQPPHSVAGALDREPPLVSSPRD
jgi:fatty acid desaturase